MVRGSYLVIDGMDGVGKGVVISAMKELAVKEYNVLDLHEYWDEHGEHPKVKDLSGVELLIVAEPTFVGFGAKIRNEMIVNKNKGKYSASEIAATYAIDRKILLRDVVQPARDQGIHVISSRSVLSSLVYQPLTGVDIEEVLDLEGNQYALAAARPSHALIPTVTDPAEVMARLAGRDKKDDSFFEKADFQAKVKDGFEDPWLKSHLMGKGIHVDYMDAGISIDSSREQAQSVYKRIFSPN